MPRWGPKKQHHPNHKMRQLEELKKFFFFLQCLKITKKVIFYLRTPSGDNSLKQPIASLKSKKPFDEPSKNFKKKRFFWSFCRENSNIMYLHSNFGLLEPQRPQEVQRRGQVGPQWRWRRKWWKIMTLPFWGWKWTKNSRFFFKKYMTRK